MSPIELINMSQKPTRGGTRPGAGRKASTPGLTVQVSVRISEEAAQVLSEKGNKSEYINNLILENK